MKEIGNSGVWTYTTPLPSGHDGYGFYVGCANATDPHSAGCAKVADPTNPAWQLPSSLATGAALNSSYVDVPSDPSFRSEDGAVASGRPSVRSLVVR
jgi:hypothetical protein